MNSVPKFFKIITLFTVTPIIFIESCIFYTLLSILITGGVEDIFRNIAMVISATLSACVLIGGIYNVIKNNNY